MNLDTCLTQYAKMKSKWIITLSVKPKIIKHLEKNLEGKFYAFGLGKYC